MRNTVLAAVVAFVIGGIATGALLADAQPAPPPGGQMMDGPNGMGGPGMGGPDMGGPGMGGPGMGGHGMREPTNPKSRWWSRVCPSRHVPLPICTEHLWHSAQWVAGDTGIRPVGPARAQAARCPPASTG